MLQIGFGEIMMIAVVSLVVLGPKRIPEAATYIGKAIALIRQLISQAKVGLAEPGSKNPLTPEEKPDKSREQ